MKIEAEIKKWGNSLALRLSGAMAEIPKFQAGTKILVNMSGWAGCSKNGI